MAEQEVIPSSTNGVDQPSPQFENDVEESMEVQTVQTVNSEDTDCVRSSSKQSEPPYDDFKLFVGGLSSETDQSTLTEYFSAYGTVVEATVKGEEKSGKSKYAFINFKEKDAVEKVLKTPHEIDGKIVDSKKFIPHKIHKEMKLRTKKIFVGGVPLDMPQSTIKSYFEKFGEVVEVAIVTNKQPERKRRGFCFVTFSSEDMADEVCAKNFHTIDGAQVEVKRATPRDTDSKKGSFSHGSSNFGRGGGRGHSHFFPPGGRGGFPPNFAPYGGHAAYYSYYPPPTAAYPGGYLGGYSNFGGGYGGYAAYEAYGNGGGGRRDDSGYNSRYGPMRSGAHHNHNHGHGGSFHPYSR